MTEQKTVKRIYELHPGPTKFEDWLHPGVVHDIPEGATAAIVYADGSVGWQFKSQTEEAP